MSGLHFPRVIVNHFTAPVDMTSAKPHRLNLKSVCIWNSDRARGLGEKKKHSKASENRAGKKTRPQAEQDVSVQMLCHLPQTPPLLLPASESHGDWSMGVERQRDHKLRRKGLQSRLTHTHYKRLSGFGGCCLHSAQSLHWINHRFLPTDKQVVQTLWQFCSSSYCWL